MKLPGWLYSERRLRVRDSRYHHPLLSTPAGSNQPSSLTLHTHSAHCCFCPLTADAKHIVGKEKVLDLALCPQNVLMDEGTHGGCTQHALTDEPAHRMFRQNALMND